MNRQIDRNTATAAATRRLSSESPLIAMGLTVLGIVVGYYVFVCIEHALESRVLGLCGVGLLFVVAAPHVLSRPEGRAER